MAWKLILRKNKRNTFTYEAKLVVFATQTVASYPPLAERISVTFYFLNAQVN